MLLMVSAKAEGHTYRVHTAGQIALGVKNNILGSLIKGQDSVTCHHI